MSDTIRSIAELTGVSTATVSRAISGRGYVNAEVAERIRSVARDRGYTPKPYTRRALSNFNSVIAVMIPDIENHYYMDVVRGIEAQMLPKGMEVILCNTAELPDREIRSLAFLRQLGIAGIIAVPVSIKAMYNIRYLQEMEQAGIPVVLLDRDVQDASMDGVFMDNYGGAYAGIQALIERGHEHIAFICGSLFSSSGAARLDGYLAALRNHGIPVREEYILHGNFLFNSAYELTHRLLKEQKAVTAIFASNSSMSCGSLLALTEAGISVPDDMAFISCGRLYGNYQQISSVVYPAEAIGEECASILLEKMSRNKRKGKRTSKRVTFSMQLLLRGSEVYPLNRAPGKRNLDMAKSNTYR